MVTGSRLPRDLDLILVMVVAVLTCALILVDPKLPTQVLGVVRACLGLALATVLPGYALTTAIFSQRSLGRWGTITYSLGLSLVLGTLGGFALNVFFPGLRPGPWAVLLSAVTLLASVLALKRRRKMAEDDFPFTQPSPKIGLRQGILLTLACLLVLSAIRLAVTGAIQQPSLGFTQFWMLPAEDGGTEVQTMRIGLYSFELEEAHYIVEIKSGNKVIQSLPCQLAPGDQIVLMVELPPVSIEGSEASSTSQSAKVEAILYRQDEPEQPYRHLVWWR